MTERLIVIVTRALPVEGAKTDVIAGTFDQNATLRELATWAREKCKGCAMISIEVCFDANAE